MTFANPAPFLSTNITRTLSLRGALSSITLVSPRIAGTRSLIFQNYSNLTGARSFSKMETNVKPIHLYSHASGPNPWKVSIILEELGLPYETEFVNPAELHTPVYEKINPNGRVPAIHDPNTDLTLWESGAIINYLMTTYDKENNLQPEDLLEKFKAQQWLFFQVSGQGPYFGQYTWFSLMHPEKIPSAIERYTNEIHRVTKVLDVALEGKEYLVGDKLTYADLSFVSWYQAVGRFPGFSLEDFKAKAPNFAAWMGKMFERPTVKKVFEYKASLAQKKA
ncbi:hypothetical protein ACMFMG_010740 [Clarireedia jacksonii]